MLDTFRNIILHISKGPKELLKKLIKAPVSLTKINPVPAADEFQPDKEYLSKFTNDLPPVYQSSIKLGPEVNIQAFGLSFREWSIHFWLEKLPIPELKTRHLINSSDEFNSLTLERNDAKNSQSSLSKIALNFQFPSNNDYQKWISELRKQQIIFDPDPSRVCFLNSLGLPAYLLDKSQISNDWLSAFPEETYNYYSRNLGLSLLLSEDIIVLGHAGIEWDKNLAYEYSKNNTEDSAIIYVPGWDEIITKDKSDSFAKAAWLNQVSKKAKYIVFVNNISQINESILHFFFRRSYILSPPFTPLELRASLKNQLIFALAEDRFKSSYDTIFSWESSSSSSISVVISLYNYSDFICNALNSVLCQTQSDIELIVVDDNSSDDGLNVVKTWMRNICLDDNHPFTKLLLLSHHRNSGLAASRNTAFSLASSEWCFVLDADNELFPDALRSCKQIADLGPNALAVVHPLLFVQADQGREDDKRTLTGLAPWQQIRLKKENTIDAMALVRRSAWQSVSGYTHIEGGWEDYDFWCKLIDKGFYGVQCPKILALYRSHKKSMSHLHTNTSWRSLSRTLQKRHPWMKPRALDE